MKHVYAVLLMLGSLIASAAPVLADSIVFEAEVVLDLRSGTDTLGLHGATLVYRSTFDTPQTYFDRFGLPTVESAADSLTITGASVPGTNGVYSSIEGIGLYPTLSGQHNGAGPNGDFASWSVGGSTLYMRNFVTAVGGISVGDNVDISHFSTTEFLDVYEDFYVGSTLYDQRSFSAIVTNVPEPSALALVGVTAIAAAWLRRRRARAVSIETI